MFKSQKESEDINQIHLMITIDRSIRKIMSRINTPQALRWYRYYELGTPIRVICLIALLAITYFE